MTDQQRSLRTTVDDESIPENNSINILDDQFRNSMEILIAEYIGAIVKNYFVEFCFLFQDKKLIIFMI